MAGGRALESPKECADTSLPPKKSQAWLKNSLKVAKYSLMRYVAA